tara:strand:- start:113 stop:310 length:198 start_codon:yes stop_codon:yes gene_type:complete
MTIKNMWTFRISWIECGDVMFEEYIAEDADHAIEQWAEMRNSVAGSPAEWADKATISTISKREAY